MARHVKQYNKIAERFNGADMPSVLSYWRRVMEITIMKIKPPSCHDQKMHEPSVDHRMANNCCVFIGVL